MEHDKTAGLILRARNGDADAFVELMERNKQSMYKTAKAWIVKVAESLTITVTENPTQDAITAQVDRESKEFEPYLKQEIATVRQFLYQARLYEREAIASVDPARSEDGSELYRDYLVTYKDERQARVAVVRQEWRFRESNWGEYPGREFLYCVPEVDPQEDLPAAFRYPDSAAREFFGGTQK